MVAKPVLSGKLALRIGRSANQHLCNVLLVFGWRVSNVNAQLAERQRSIHVVDLPIALQRVDQTFGVFADKSTRHLLAVNLQLEEVWEGCVVTDVFNLSVREVIIASSAAAHPQRVIDEKDSSLTQYEELAITLNLNHGDIIGRLANELLQCLNDGLRYLC